MAGASSDTPGPPARITLTLPVTLEVAGHRGAVRVDVADEQGRAVADGTAVLLDTSLGQLGSSSLTTHDGLVTTTLETGTQAGTARVTAASGDVITHSEVAFVAGAVARLELSPESVTGSVDRSLALTVAGWDEFGNAARMGTAVSLTPTAGVVTPTVALMHAGIASAEWRNTSSGVAYVTASLAAAQASAAVDFLPGPAASLDVGVSNPILPVDDGQTAVEARLLDRYGNRSREAHRVVFSATGGVVRPAAVDTEKGTAAAVYAAGPAPGTFEVSAAAGGLRGAHAVELRPAGLVIARSDVLGPRGSAMKAQTYPGEPLTYTVVARNEGMAVARDVVMGVELPQPVEVGSSTASASVTELERVPTGLLSPPSEEQRQIAWSLPDLSAGDSLTMTIVGKADPSYRWSGFDVLFYRAALTTTTALSAIARLARTDTAQVYAADVYVSVELDGEASSLRPGGQLVYEIAFGNLQRQTDVGTVRITDTLPALARFDHWQPARGVILRPVSEFDASVRELVWEFDGPFGLSQGLRLWLDIDVDAPAESVLENAVAIGSRVLDVRADNNKRTDGGVRLRGVNLVTTMSGPGEVAPGGELRYEVRLRNLARHDTAHDVELYSILPPNVKVRSTNPLGLVLLDGRVRWQVPTLTPGAERRFELLASAPANAAVGTFIRNRVEASSRDLESHEADNSAEVWTLVVPGPPSTVALSADRPELPACGAEAATIQAAVSDAHGNVVADGTAVRWSTTAGAIAPAESATLDGRATALLRATGDAGKAMVRAVAAEASGEVEIDLLPGPPAALAVTADPSVVRRGGRTDVTVSVLDACANPVADGWPIELEAERGHWMNGAPVVTLPTRGGGVLATLTVGKDVGPLRVSARHAGSLGEVLVSVDERFAFELFAPYAGID